MFVTGLLVVLDESRLRSTIQNLRKRTGFANEFHFKKTSDSRSRIYAELIRECAQLRQWVFTAIVVYGNLLDLRYFSRQKYLAYNYFTRLLLKRKCGSFDVEEFITDKKTREREDNFESYLRLETTARKVFAKCSKTDDLLQFTDLLTGCVAYRHRGENNPKKKTVSDEAYRVGAVGGDWIWVWRPNPR